MIDALLRAGVAERDIYLDIASGAKASRPKDEAVEYVARQVGVEPGEAGAHSAEPGPRPAVCPEPAEHR